MKLRFASFATIMAGMSLIGFSVGYILGYYVHREVNIVYWVYVSAPVLGFGSALIIYGALFKRKIED